MAKYALIVDGYVHELFETELPIGELFHASLDWRDVDSVDGVAVGWSVDGGGAYHAPPAPAAPTAEILAPGIQRECRDRIIARVSQDTQRNLTAYSAKLTKDVVVMAAVLTNDQKADLATADAIFEWINGVGGMLATARALVVAVDTGYRDDGKWPAWTDAWSALVARF